MKLHRFFVKDLVINDNNEIELSDFDVIHQIINVLRMKKGEKVFLLDSQNTQHLSSLKQVLNKKLIFSKEKMKKKSRKNEFFLKIYPSVIKKDKLEYVIQKCTEIGVSKFQPIISTRTEKLNFRIERARKIITEAAEQSEKVLLPQIVEPITLDQFRLEYETVIKNTKEDFVSNEKSFAFFLDINAPILQIEKTRKKFDSFHVFVGPEGGWSDKDREIFEVLDIKSVSLGRDVLRAETASIAISALLLLGR